MPKITENVNLRDYFLEKLREKYDVEREGIHISGLVYCLRETFARKYMPLPQTLTSLFYFLDGEQRHKGFQGLVPYLQNEVEIKNEGLIGTMDLFGKFIDIKGTKEFVEGVIDTNSIIEIKSTRAKPRGEIPPHYLRQGAYYCLLEGKKSFTLMTQHINHGEIVFLDVEFSDDELSDFYKDMIGGRDLLVRAYEAADEAKIQCKENEKFLRQAYLNIFDALPMCRESMRWKCTNCLYHGLCFIDKEEVKKK
jgi:hypothetical protein